MILALISLSCAGTPIVSCSCDPTLTSPSTRLQDGVGLAYRSFVGVSSHTTLVNPTDKSPVAVPQVRSTIASGVIIYRSEVNPSIGFVLTAKHFCDHMNDHAETKINHTFFVHDSYGRRHVAKHHFSVDKPNVDACVLSINDMSDDLAVAPVGVKQPELGERVFNIAAPKGIFGNSTMLTFEGFYAGGPDAVAAYTIPVAGGSSGSPVFNKMGHVVGMIWGYPLRGGHRVLENIAYSIRLSHIREIYNSLESSDAIVNRLVETSSTTEKFEHPTLKEWVH